MCCERVAKKAENGQPFGRIFWCVSIELVEEDSSDSDESTDENNDSEGAEYIEADNGAID